MCRSAFLALALAAMAAASCAASARTGSEASPPGQVPSQPLRPGSQPQGELTIGPLASDPEAPAATEQACDADSFWDDKQCLPRRETLSGNIATFIPRCEQGDDQACPVALELLQHDCQIGDETQCVRARALLDTWLIRRDRRWIASRCQRGQYAACLLGAEQHRRGCEDDKVEDCRLLSEALDADPRLGDQLDVSSSQVWLRACELGLADPACNFEEGGLGLSPQLNSPGGH